MRSYLEDFLSTQHDRSTPAVHTVQVVLADLPQRLRAHVQSDMTLPFIALDGTEMFIRKGIRQRRKEKRQVCRIKATRSRAALYSPRHHLLAPL